MKTYIVIVCLIFPAMLRAGETDVIAVKMIEEGKALEVDHKWDDAFEKFDQAARRSDENHDMSTHCDAVAGKMRTGLQMRTTPPRFSASYLIWQLERQGRVDTAAEFAILVAEIEQRWYEDGTSKQIGKTGPTDGAAPDLHGLIKHWKNAIDYNERAYGVSDERTIDARKVAIKHLQESRRIYIDNYKWNRPKDRKKYAAAKASRRQSCTSLDAAIDDLEEAQRLAKKP